MSWDYLINYLENLRNNKQLIIIYKHIIKDTNFYKKIVLINIEIRNPKTPSIKIPIAETFVIVSNSFLEGFFNTCQTRLHFIAKDVKD